MNTPRQQGPQGVFMTAPQVHNQQQYNSARASTPTHTVAMPPDPRFSSMPYANTPFQPQMQTIS